MRSATWNNITVEQYQLIHSINEEELDEVDKIIRIISVLYDLTETEVNNLPVTTFRELTTQVASLFTGEFPGTAKGIIKANGKRYSLSYDIGKFRLAQYIEAQHFLKGGIIPNLHLIAASIAAPVKFRFFTGKNDSGKHPEVSNDILQAKFIDVYNSVVFFCDVFNKWNKGYSGLLENDDDDEEFDDLGNPLIRKQNDDNDFNDRYGWIFSATRIKEHEGITLDQTFDLPVIQAFNDLAYLKGLKQHEEELNKKAREKAQPV